MIREFVAYYATLLHQIVMILSLSEQNNQLEYVTLVLFGIEVEYFLSYKRK
jgi:hypothetical protein